MNEEIKIFLEEKREALGTRFKENKEKAEILLKQKNVVDSGLKRLMDEGSLILAKLSAINEMLKE